MPDLHPIAAVLVDGTPPSKADVRGYAKLRNRVRVADADEVRNTDFSGQYAGLYVGDLQDVFDLDALDTTSTDDGVNCIIDGGGNRFKLVSPATPSTVPTYREVTAAGDIDVLTSDDIIGVNKTSGAVTNINLGAASARGGKPITIKDIKGDASSNAITPVTSGGELINGLAASNYEIAVDSGSITLYPRSGGWYTLG